MNTIEDFIAKLKPRDPWFGATLDEAPIRAMRDSIRLSGEQKLQWLEEAYSIFNTITPPKAGSVPLPPIIQVSSTRSQ